MIPLWRYPVVVVLIRVAITKNLSWGLDGGAAMLRSTPYPPC